MATVGERSARDASTSPWATGRHPTADVTAAPSGELLPADRALGLLPRETRLVVYLDVAALRLTRAWKAAGNRAHDNPDASRAVARLRSCRLDPVADLEAIALGCERAEERRCVLLVAGRGLDASRIAGCLGSDRAPLVPREYDGHDLYARSDPPGLVVAAVSPSLVAIAGDEDEARSVLDRAAARDQGADRNRDLMALASRVAGSGAGWGAAILPGLLVKRAAADDSAQILSGVKGIYGSLDADTGLDVTVTALCAEPEAARDLLDAARLEVDQIRPAVRAFGLEPALDDLSLGARGTTVTASLAVSPNDSTATAGALVDLAAGWAASSTATAP